MQCYHHHHHHHHHHPGAPEPLPPIEHFITIGPATFPIPATPPESSLWDLYPPTPSSPPSPEQPPDAALTPPSAPRPARAVPAAVRNNRRSAASGQGHGGQVRARDDRRVWRWSGAGARSAFPDWMMPGWPTLMMRAAAQRRRRAAWRAGRGG